MIRAHAANDQADFGVALYILNQRGDDDYPREALRITACEAGRPSFMWDPRTPGAITMPTLTLPDEMGRALLDALAHHYQGTEDHRALRRDYDAERKRVDQLLEHLAAIARTTPEPRSTPMPAAAATALEAACKTTLEEFGMVLYRRPDGYSVAYESDRDDIKFVFVSIDQVTDFTEACAKASAS